MDAGDKPGRRTGRRGDDAGWTLRTVSLGPHAIEVSLQANEQRLHSIRVTQYVIMAIITVLAAFLPAPAAVHTALDFAAGGASGWLAGSSSVAPGSDAGGHPWLRRGLDLLVRLALASIALKVLVPQPVVQESLVALRGVGVQMRAVHANGASSSQFIDAHSLREIIVHEGIQTCSVRYYMALVVTGREKLVLAFDAARPRLPVLSRIYRTIHPVMYPELHADDDTYEFMQAASLETTGSS